MFRWLYVIRSSENSCVRFKLNTVWQEAGKERCEQLMHWQEDFGVVHEHRKGQSEVVPEHMWQRNKVYIV